MKILLYYFEIDMLNGEELNLKFDFNYQLPQNNSELGKIAIVINTYFSELF